MSGAIQPKQARAEGALPHALTFFLTSDQRRAVLRTLNAHHRDRAMALLSALRVESDGQVIAKNKTTKKKTASGKTGRSGARKGA